MTVEGVRFEVPSAYRTLSRVELRVARWDLSIPSRGSEDRQQGYLSGVSTLQV